MIPRDEDSSVELDNFPVFEMILGPKYKTHDCWVTWRGADGAMHRFLIGFQYRPDLPTNKALNSDHGVPISGELVVMMADESNGLTGIRGRRSRSLAHEAARRYASLGFGPFVYPSHITLLLHSFLAQLILRNRLSPNRRTLPKHIC